uniref:hypothetical protein n=1 Tax=Mesorhizobium silamurunense TaxID=499528 RepID=UPI0017845986
MGALLGVGFAGRRIANSNCAIVPHGVNYHCQLARHRDTDLTPGNSGEALQMQPIF